MKIILASNSPRRVQILGEIFDNVIVLPQDVDESCRLIKPSAKVMAIACKKVQPLVLNKSSVVIGADTLVFMKGQYFPKPKDSAQAFEFLRKLAGQWHNVYTGVAVAFGGQVKVFYDVSRVKFFDVDDVVINDYIKSGSPFDKAGGYGIQDSGLVEKYVGSYTNIVGLPKEKLLLKLKEYGII